jgi:lysyl-tRNA synthetase class I
MKKQPYLYLPGLKKLAKKVRGTEHIHIGIRPYGFHGGNALSLFVYPYLLCKEIEKLGKEPRFTFFISINDFEQDELDGPDYRRYPFNIYPKNTSLQYTSDDSGCCNNITDHWQPVIEKIVNLLKEDYPKLKIKFVRNSSLKNKKYFKVLLLDTLKNPQDHVEIFKKYSDKEILESPIQYAGVICPKCKKSHGTTTVISSKKIRWECRTCNCKIEKPYEYFSYWWYHKAMFSARMKTFGIHIAMSGADHYNEGDYNIRRCFFKRYFKNFSEPIMMFCPVLIARDGQKMSKSRHNAEFVKIKELILLAESTESGEIILPDKLIENTQDEKTYASNFALEYKYTKGLINRNSDVLQNIQEKIFKK